MSVSWDLNPLQSWYDKHSQGVLNYSTRPHSFYTDNILKVF